MAKTLLIKFVPLPETRQKRILCGTTLASKNIHATAVVVVLAEGTARIQ